jgi:hypothetical protein
MNRREKLERKHGTYREFEDAAWATLGECSVDEIMQACDAYRRELADATLADLADPGICTAVHAATSPVGLSTP